MSDHQIEPEVADVVVVGGGGAGLAAAVSAATRGMRTFLLEKNPELGGTTRLAVGSFSAACTRLQRRAGIADSVDDFRADMEAFTGDLAGRDNPKLRSLLAAEAGVTLQWLEDLGVVFAGPFPEPPHRVSRMHNAIPGSHMYVAKLARAAQRAGVIIQTAATVDRLVTDGHGTVVGLDYTRNSVRHHLSARRGIILATGDFSGNREMRKTFLTPAAVAAIPCNPCSNGDGHRLARQVGAGWRNMDIVFGPHLRFAPGPKPVFANRLPHWSWLARLGADVLMRAPSWMLKRLVTPMLLTWMSPSDRIFREGAILVDLDGRRLNAAKPGVSVAESREATGYIILNERIAGVFAKYPNFISTAPGIAYAYFPDYARTRPDIVHRAASVGELARKIAVTADQLRASVEGLGGGVLFALGPVHAVLSKTEGSIAVDEQCRVLKEDGAPIDGLYAAGSAGQGGMPMKGHGLHLAWAMTSGRIAGEMVARRLPDRERACRPGGQSAVFSRRRDHNELGVG